MILLIVFPQIAMDSAATKPRGKHLNCPPRQSSVKWEQNGRNDLRMLAEECKSVIDMYTVPSITFQQKFWLHSEYLGLMANFYDALL